MGRARNELSCSAVVFGGAYAAIHLEKLLARVDAVEICLVSRDNFFLFTPMLHEIAASDLQITNIVNPLRKLLRNVEVLVGDVNQIDLPNKRVLISRGYRKHSRQIDYDPRDFQDTIVDARAGSARSWATRINSCESSLSLQCCFKCFRCMVSAN